MNVISKSISLTFVVAVVVVGGGGGGGGVEVDDDDEDDDDGDDDDVYAEAVKNGCVSLFILCSSISALSTLSSYSRG